MTKGPQTKAGVSAALLTILFTSVAAASTPLAFATVPTFTTFFEDDFDGAFIDGTKWNASIATSGNRWCSDTLELHHSNPGMWLDPASEGCHGIFENPPYGSVIVSNGKASFSASPMRSFPYIWRGPPSRGSLFPSSGDFAVETRIKFDRVGNGGTGLAVVPWANSDPEGNNPPIPQAFQGMILLVWADASGLYVRTVGNSFIPLPGALDFHVYRLENIGGSYSLFFDGSLVAGPIVSGIRPYTMWLGNPALTYWEVPERSDFSVDYVRVLVPTSANQVFSDDFNDDIRNSSTWNSFNVGSGPTAAETNQRLEITFPQTSSDDGVLHVFGAGYTSVCQFRGDFDIQTDFQLLVWPFSNGVRLGMGGPEATFLTATPMNSAVERVSFGDFSADYSGQFREVYLTHFSDGVQGITPTGELSGRLRLVRAGSTLTGFYFSDNNWITIHGAQTAVNDFHVSLVSWSHDYAFTNQFVRIAFDNFIVSQGMQVCPQGISVSKFFTDSDANALPIDSIGNPKVDVILANGIVRSTNPGQVLAWVNVTNTGQSPLQSVAVNETLPVDWVVQPEWLPPSGAIHAFFAFANKTRAEITDSATISVGMDNPQTVSLSIPDLTDTAAGKSLAFGESILLSIKMSYGLQGTSQSASSFPRNYSDTASAGAWMQPSFAGPASSATISAPFVAYARVVGDVDGNFHVDILDAALLAYSFGATTKDENWTLNADFDYNGVIDILDAAQLAAYYGASS